MHRAARLPLSVLTSTAVVLALSTTAFGAPSDDPSPDDEVSTEKPAEPAPEPEPDPDTESPTADRGATDVETAPPLLFPRPTEIVTAGQISDVPFTPPAAPPADDDDMAQARRVSTTPAPDFLPTLPVGSLFDVVITEVHYNPSAVYDSRGEFFEIYNDGLLPLDLSGWTFGDEIYDKHTISSLTIAPGDYAVLARFGEFDRNGGVAADYVYGDSVLLFNVGDQIVLRDSLGFVVDVVDYSLDEFPDPVGSSISLVDISADNADGDNWCVSTTPLVNGDHASPGAANQCGQSRASLEITEILNNPGRTSDFTGEWFEIHNTGNTTVDLNGFGIKDDDRDWFTVEHSVVVEPGERAIAGVLDDPARNGGVDVDIVYGDAMRLHNSFDELVIVDTLGIEVDAVRWDDGRTFPDPNGASMHLQSGASDNSNGENWCTSARRWATGDFGSPGVAGNCTPTEYPDIVITEVMFDPERTSPERAGEWFELMNNGSETAVLDGFVLRTYSTQHTIGDLTIEPGARVVVASDGDVAENGGVSADYVVGGDLPLYNTTSTLEVVAPDGTLLDRVRWTASLGFPFVKGHSMEVRGADVDNLLGPNWCAATDRYGDGDFGTPGTAGSCDEPAPAPSLVISEIMRNPAAVSDIVGEWLEIHNPTADAVDLLNWSIGDESSEYHVITESIEIEPGGYAVIARNADPAVNGGVAADYATGSAMVLLNSGDTVVINDRYGQFVDSFSWTNSDLFPRPNGGSIARTDASLSALAPGDDASGWCATSTQYGDGDRGTPGAANDCVVAPNHAIVINEIHRDPKATPDAQGEWIELHNSGDVDIDISGWTLRDDDVDTFVFDTDNPVVVPAGGYLVAGRNTEELNGGIEIDVQYGVEFIHFNTADEVVLLDDDLAVIDRVAWTATNGFPKVSGATMSLRSADLNNAVGANWCAAVTDQGNGDLGTPGSQNLCELPDPGPSPVDLSYSMFAIADDSCRGEVTLNGSEIVVGTRIRSNDDFSVNGGLMTFLGAVSYADSAQIGWGAQMLGGVEQEAGVQADPFGWSLADFAPGGAMALAAGDDYTSHSGTWRVTGNAADIPAGLHYVDGDVHFATGTTHLNGVTIVATGSIKINSNSVSLSPYSPDMPTLFAGEDRCNKSGIQFSASLINVSGALYSPDARLKMNSSMLTATDASLVGAAVQIDGSNILVNLLPSL
jgi:Lamin Tail Domain